MGAMLDLGADQEHLMDALNSLPLDGYDIEISYRNRSAVRCCDFDVKLEHDNHDHDMAYLHGHDSEDHYHEHHHGDHEHGHEGHEHHHGDHEHGHEGHEHSHGDHEHGHEGHEHSHGDHGHTHRGMKEIRDIINAGDLTQGARALALRIFEIIGEAEAAAHGLSVDEVHFHEVGAVDSIVDIVAAAVCFDELGIREVIIPELSEGRGTVRCQHGILPIPVPAVLNITEKHGLPLHITRTEGELVTPTGAAIAAAIRTDEVLPEKMIVRKTGLGAGKREYDCPGFLRAMVIEDTSVSEDQLIKLETNIDDCSGELLGYVMELLLKNGARDVFYSPVFMKKNRPAWLLSVLCTEDRRTVLEDIIFNETTTIGIRRISVERTILQREMITVQTPEGPVTMKKCKTGTQVFYYPEYESAAALAARATMPLKEIYRIAEEAANHLALDQE